MTIKIGINGFGRIGRAVFREAQKRQKIKIVAINDLLDINYLAYAIKYDSTHGRSLYSIFIENNYLIINGNKIRYTSEKNPSKLKWNEEEIDVVIESSGMFLTNKSAYNHIISGARKVIITSPTKDDIPMFVMGVNHKMYNGQNIVSNSSCTTNCLAPLAKVINKNFGIKEALMTTVHSTTSTQNIIDGKALKDYRIGRGSIQNIIPYSTGAAKSIYKIIPELENKLTGISFRVPTPNVSVVDLTVKLEKSTKYKNICDVIKKSTEKEFKGIMGYSNEYNVSTDFNGEKLISIFDEKSSLSLNDTFVKLISWYDNETGYSSKVLDLAIHIIK